VALDAAEREAGRGGGAAGEFLRAVVGDAELALLLPRRDVAVRARTSSSSSLSTLKRRTPAWSAAFISSSVFPTPEKTTVAGSAPTASTRRNSPSETMSKPVPSWRARRRRARFPFALTA
jgi:hypothetical protein